MYKTQYSLAVWIKGAESPEIISDAAIPSSGTTALNQIKACRDIDFSHNGIGMIIPYHAIEYVVVTTTRTETEDPVDDNCIVDGGDEPAETGTLTIINGLDLSTTFDVFISQPLDGTYGDLTFSSDDGGDPFPDGYYAFATVMDLASGSSVTAPELPYATNVVVYPASGLPMFGSVPVTLTIGSDPGPGPK